MGSTGPGSAPSVVKKPQEVRLMKFHLLGYDHHVEEGVIALLQPLLAQPVLVKTTLES